MFVQATIPVTVAPKLHDSPCLARVLPVSCESVARLRITKTHLQRTVINAAIHRATDADTQSVWRFGFTVIGARLDALWGQCSRSPGLRHRGFLRRDSVQPRPHAGSYHPARGEAFGLRRHSRFISAARHCGAGTEDDSGDGRYSSSQLWLSRAGTVTKFSSLNCCSPFQRYPHSWPPRATL